MFKDLRGLVEEQSKRNRASAISAEDVLDRLSRRPRRWPVLVAVVFLVLVIVGLMVLTAPPWIASLQMDLAHPNTEESQR